MSQLTLSLPDAWSSITSSPWALAGTALGVVALSYVLTRPGKQNSPPSHRAVPLLGDGLFRLLKQGNSWHDELWERYGNTFFASMLFKKHLWVCKYEDVKALLGSEHDLVEVDWPPTVKGCLGEKAVSVVIHGKEHLMLRKALNPLFSPAAIRGYMPQVQAIAEACVGSWLKQGDIKAGDEIKALTFQVMMDVVMGLEMWADPAVGRRLTASWKVFTAGIFSPFTFPGSPFRKALAVRAELVKDIDKAIEATQERLAERQASGQEADEGRQATALERLVAVRDEQGRPLPHKQLQDLAITLAWAGHDTSSSAVSRALQLLAAHPAVLARLRAEQQAVVAQHGEAITEAVLRESTYLDAVVRESLRLHPTVAALFRRAKQDLEVGGYRVKAGTKLFLCLHEVLRRDSRWAHLPDDSPLAWNKFSPERWLEGGGADSRAGGWVPFGAGPRMCVGYPLALAEIKIVLAVLVRRATWALADPSEGWDDFPLPVPKKGLAMRVAAVEA